MKKVTAFICSPWIFILLACSTENLENKQAVTLPPVSEKNALHKPKSTYMKPGAAIRFGHNYDGSSEVGDIEKVRLSFAESYDAGQMRVMLNADPALNMEPAEQQFSFSMDAQQIHELDITLEPQTEGKYYLNIFTSATEGSGQAKSRVFAIAFYVGDPMPKQSKPAKQSSSENMIFLPSQETAQ